MIRRYRSLVRSEADRLADEDDVDPAGQLLVDLQHLPHRAVLPVLVDPLVCRRQVRHQLLRADHEDHARRAPGVGRELAARRRRDDQGPVPMVACEAGADPAAVRRPGLPVGPGVLWRSGWDTGSDVAASWPPLLRTCPPLPIVEGTSACRILTDLLTGLAWPFS